MFRQPALDVVVHLPTAQGIQKGQLPGSWLTVIHCLSVNALLSGGCEKFELDVVRVPKDEHRGVWLVSDRRLGEWLVGCVGSYDAVGLEVLLPEFKVAAGRYREAAMIETGRGLGEQAAVICLVSVQGEHQLPVATRENFPAPPKCEISRIGWTSKTDSYHRTLASRSVTVIAKWCRRGWVTLGMIFLDWTRAVSSGVRNWG